MGHASYLGRFSRDNRWAADLGSGTSGAFPSHLHTTAVAQLACEGRIYYRGLYACTCATLHCELGWINFPATLVDACWNTVGNTDGYLHRISLRTGKGTRHVAKPAIAAAPVFPVGTPGFSGTVTADDHF